MLKPLFVAPSRRRLLLAVATLTIAAGCTTQPSPTVPPASPSPGVSPSGSPAASSTPAPQVFRDDFSGPALDEARWSVFKQSGVVAIQDGKLEVLNSNGNENYPYLLAKGDVVPATGPFFLEVAYAYITVGAVSFTLDYLPADHPDDRALSQPFMYTYPSNQGLRARFATETKDLYYTAPQGLTLRTPHVLRIENDGNRQYRVIADGIELGKFESSRRPTRFWIGYPKSEAPTKIWGRVQVDHVEAGTLVTPAEARPLATPTPSGSPSPGASTAP